MEHKTSEQAHEFAYIIQQLSREERLILRNIMLTKLYRRRAWEIKDLEDQLDLRGLHILG